MVPEWAEPAVDPGAFGVVSPSAGSADSSS